MLTLQFLQWQSEVRASSGEDRLSVYSMMPQQHAPL